MKLNQFLRTALVACAAVFTIGVGLSTQAPTVSASSATYKTVATTSIKKSSLPQKVICRGDLQCVTHQESR